MIEEITTLKGSQYFSVDIDDGFITIRHDGDDIFEGCNLAQVDAIIELLTEARSRIADHLRYQK